MSNPNFNQILTTTLDHRRKKLTNNVFMDFPLSYWLMDKSRTRMINGGRKILEELRYALGQAEFYTMWDQFAIAPQTGFTAAEYDWKQARASVAIAGLEEAQNNGEDQVIDLLDAKIEQAEDSLKQLFYTALWGDGTGAGGDAFAGLQSYITTANTAVGGIDGATQTYWRNVVRDHAAGVLTLKAVKQLVNRVAEGNNKPDAMFAPLDVFEAVEGFFQPQVQYRDVKAANAGFDNITVNGVPLFGDNGGSAVALRIYAINSKYLTIVGHANKWFANSPFMDGTATAHATSGAANSVDGRYSVIYVYGNLTCSNRARQGVLHNFTLPA